MNKIAQTRFLILFSLSGKDNGKKILPLIKKTTQFPTDNSDRMSSNRICQMGTRRMTWSRCLMSRFSYVQKNLQMVINGGKMHMLTFHTNSFLQGLAKAIENVPDAKKKLMDSFNGKMNGASEKLTVKHPVKELLFEGFGVRPYQEYAEEKSEVLNEVGSDFMFPETFMDGRFGLFEKVIKRNM